MASDVRPSLTLTRRFKQTPGRLFSAWTQPDQIARWFGPPGTQVTEAEFDPRVGGRFRVVATTSDGQEHCVSGEVREVVAGEKLVYTWAWRDTPERESLVTVEFRRDGDGTLLVLTHERFFDEPARDRHRHGWSGSLDKLESWLALAAAP